MNKQILEHHEKKHLFCTSWKEKKDFLPFLWNVIKTEE